MRPYMVSIQNLIFETILCKKKAKVQFPTILLPDKKCVTKKRTYVNKACNLLTVLFSIPLNK